MLRLSKHLSGILLYPLLILLWYFPFILNMIWLYKIWCTRWKREKYRLRTSSLLSRRSKYKLSMIKKTIFLLVLDQKWNKRGRKLSSSPVIKSLQIIDLLARQIACTLSRGNWLSLFLVKVYSIPFNKVRWGEICCLLFSWV